MEIPQKIKKRTAKRASKPTPRYLSEENENTNVKRYIFIAVLFTIAKIWKQPKCTSIDGERRCGIHTPTHSHTHTHMHTQQNTTQL